MCSCDFCGKEIWFVYAEAYKVNPHKEARCYVNQSGETRTIFGTNKDDTIQSLKEQMYFEYGSKNPFSIEVREHIASEYFSEKYMCARCTGKITAHVTRTINKMVKNVEYESSNWFYVERLYLIENFDLVVNIVVSLFVDGSKKALKKNMTREAA